MRRLIIETATEALSLALVERDKVIGAVDLRIGRGHAERLVPEIAALPDGGKSDSIWVDVGPGSFTGVRIGIAAARALAIAWNAECKGFHCATAIAMTACKAAIDTGTQGFLIVMDGGHGEWLVASCKGADERIATPASMTPEIAVRHTQHLVVGPRAEDFVIRRGYGEGHNLFPSASAMRRAGADHLLDEVSPIYARAPDAKPMKTIAVQPAS